MTASVFSPIEATIETIHEGYRGASTCETVVQAYLDRIAAYDQKGPALNAFAAINPQALDEARRLDRKFAETGALVGPLHGIPIAVKDQAETAGIPTCFGSVALKGYVPTEDATIVAKLKAAGAIIIGKTTLPDFVTSWFGYSSARGKPGTLMTLRAIPAGRAPVLAQPLRRIWRRWASAKTPVARSACRRASTILSARA